MTTHATTFGQFLDRSAEIGVTARELVAFALFVDPEVMFAVEIGEQLTILFSDGTSITITDAVPVPGSAAFN